MSSKSSIAAFRNWHWPLIIAVIMAISACSASRPAPPAVGPAILADTANASDATVPDGTGSNGTGSNGTESNVAASNVTVKDVIALEAALSTEGFDPNEALHKLTYHIDRTQVPLLYYQDLTLKVTVNQIAKAVVTADGTIIPHTYDAAAGKLIFTTNADTVDITLSGVTDPTGLGDVEKAALKDDKSFAWSHGMDDNVYVKAQVDVLEEYGWRGTIFLISNVVEDERNEDWIVDAPYLKEKLANGWSIGNHSWDHNCEPATVTEQTVLDGYNRLRQIVDTSPVPTYQIISFAAPCFLSEYQPIIQAHRDNQINAVQFNESGDRLPLVVDPGVTEDITDPSNAEQFLAAAFSYDAPIGRSIRIEYEDLALEMATLDLMASLHNEQGLHLWHNTLAHGDTETGPESHAGRLATVAAYVESTYGASGSNQIWVAPSDQIYSYLLVRDRAVVSLTGIDQ